jgi:hypothetical protein
MKKENIFRERILLMHLTTYLLSYFSRKLLMQDQVISI